MRALNARRDGSSYRRSLARALWVASLAACTDDAPSPTPSTSEAPLASVRIMIPAVEPFDSAAAVLQLLDARGRFLPSAGLVIEWSSSDTTIANVVAGTVTGIRPGNATITARVSGIQAGAIARVAWRPEARLIIARGSVAAGIGDEFELAPQTTRAHVPVAMVEWISRDSNIVRLDGPGVFRAASQGNTTLVGRIAGLEDSVVVEVTREGGFGYFYSANFGLVADGTLWIPDPGRSYTTAGAINVLWGDLYASQPDLGWIGPTRPVGDAVLHVVSLESTACTAYLQTEEGIRFVTPGAPLLDCLPPDHPSSLEFLRMEFVAFRPAAFTGTMAVSRPDGSSFATNGGSIRMTSSALNSHDYLVKGMSSDSLFWFVAPGAPELASCVTAPRQNLPSTLSARVICAGWRGTLSGAAAYVIGFGPDVRRGTAPIGMIEIAATGAISRKSVTGLEITTSGASLGDLMLSVSGERLASFDRIPATLVTAISSSPVPCSIQESGRAARSIDFHLTCPADVVGATIGIVY